MLLRCCLAVVLSFSLVHAASAQVETVTPDDPSGWLIGPFGAPPPVEFVDGPDTPPLGSGSYRAAIVDPASKIILLRNEFHDLPLSDLTALSFWTYVDPVASNTNNWYVNLYLDADGDGVYETRLDYVPPPAQVATGMWQFWDAFLGVWQINTGGSSTLADFLIANPNARINAFNLPEGGALRWNMGDTASSYVGFVGNLDGVRVAVNGVGDVTWDFERTGVPIQAIPTLDAPFLVVLAVLFLMVGTWRLRRRVSRSR
ncbi:MAG: hypothetical protein AAF481_17235 [Acidobacteriota bacterium]